MENTSCMEGTMEILRTINDMKTFLTQNSNQQIGFVPTMGYFHEGHTTLMDHAKEENDLVVVSIFVNPLQFGDQKDLQTYPRDEERDCAIAQEHGVDCVFIPSVEEMYPYEMEINMRMHGRTNQLCGATRPGHFDGVLTVLTKLFNIVEPDRVYFGLKDAQQVAVVYALITEFNFSIELRGVATVREENGLAKSSRNVHLLPEELDVATSLYASLQSVKQAVEQGETNVDTLLQHAHKRLEENGVVKIDYFQILSYPFLQEITTINGQVIIAIAVHFEHARLIDNIIIDETGNELDRL